MYSVFFATVLIQEAHRKGVCPPKLQTMCDQNSFFDISMVCTQSGPLAEPTSLFSVLRLRRRGRVELDHTLRCRVPG